MATDPPASRTQRAALTAIRWYQEASFGRPSPCRFTPSCSSYAAEAYRSHGTARGSWLTVRRLVRCRPFGPSGFDPVPSPPDHTDSDPTSATSSVASSVACKDC